MVPEARRLAGKNQNENELMRQVDDKDNNLLGFKY
jgi:hypothetical protein